MKDILDKRLLLFMGIAFFLPLGALYLHGLTENNTAQFVLYGIGAAAPSIAAMVVVISEGETASFLRGSFKRSGIIKALILPFGIVFLTMFLTKGISCFLLKEPFSVNTIPLSQLIVIMWALVAEEFGWRGYLHQFLGKRLKRLCLRPFIIGVIWCLWHYHYFLSGRMQAPMVWFAVGCIAESYIYDYLLHVTDNQLLSAMVYHFAWNLLLHIFAINPADNMGNELPYIVMSVIEIGVGIRWGILIARTRVLNPHYRI